MDFKKLPDDQWKAFRNLPAHMESLTATAVEFVRDLSSRCKDVDSLRNAGFDIAPVEGAGPVLATIQSPFGSGRIKLIWRVEATDLVAHLAFEQSVEDAYEKKFWSTVWGLKLSLEHGIVSGSSVDALRVTDSPYKDDREMSYFAVLLAVFYSFSGGDLRVSEHQQQ